LARPEFKDPKAVPGVRATLVNRDKMGQLVWLGLLDEWDRLVLMDKLEVRAAVVQQVPTVIMANRAELDLLVQVDQADLWDHPDKQALWEIQDRRDQQDLGRRLPASVEIRGRWEAKVLLHRQTRYDCV